MCLFSATLPAWIRTATRKYMRQDRVTIDLIGDDKIKTAETVEHKKIRYGACAPRALFDERRASTH